MASPYEELIAMELAQNKARRGSAPLFPAAADQDALLAMQQPEVEAVAKGSGLKRGAATEGKQRGEAFTTRALMMDPEELSKAYQAALNTEAVKSQMAGVESLGKLAEVEAGAPIQEDYSPLVALADIWSKSGGQLAKGYRAPERPEATRSRATSIAAKAQDDRRDVTKSILDFIQKQKAGTSVEKLLTEIQTKLSTTAEDPNKALGRGRDPSMKAASFMKDFGNDQEVKDLRIGISAVREGMNALQGENWLGDNVVRSSLVTAAKLFPVSNLDIQQYAGSPALLDKFNRILSKATEGKPFLPEDRAVIEKYMKGVADLSQKELGGKTRIYAETMGPAYGYAPEEAMKKLAFKQTGLYKGQTTDVYDPKKRKPQNEAEEKIYMKYLQGKRGK